MSLFRWELKKIWNPGILLALALLGVLYYWLFPYFYIQYFCNGPDAEAQYALAMEWVEEYGPTLETQERAELDGQLARERETFRQQISAIPQAAAEGLGDYESFSAFCSEYYAAAMESDSQADMEKEALIHRVYGGTNCLRIQALEGYLAAYDSQPALREELLARSEEDWGSYTPAMIRRQLQTSQTAFSYGPLLGSMEAATREYGKDLAVWCVLSVILLLSPTLLRDRLRKTRALQWASRRGRGIFRTQMAAAFFSALALTAVNLTLYALPFLARGPLAFGRCQVGALFGESACWLDWNYGGYLLALAGLILALSLGAAGLALFLSQYSSNFVSMLLRALPLFALVGAGLGSWLLDQPFFFRSFWPQGPWVPKGTEFFLAIGLLPAGLLLCTATGRSWKKRDLV